MQVGTFLIGYTAETGRQREKDALKIEFRVGIGAILRHFNDDFTKFSPISSVEIGEKAFTPISTDEIGQKVRKILKTEDCIICSYLAKRNRTKQVCAHLNRRNRSKSAQASNMI